MNQHDSETRQKWEELLVWFRSLNRVGVALSGGVDSAVTCAAAAYALGNDNVTAFTIQSPMELDLELKVSGAIANYLNVTHVVIAVDELADINIQANPVERCYFCKSLRMQEIIKEANKYDIDKLVDGSNFDDLDDFRPGRKALQEQGVFSPLAETGITKELVRRMARWLGLFVWDKPSTPCLASRIPYGVTINLEKINQIACAERSLIKLGLKTVRVRYHHEIARIEVPIEDFKVLLENQEQVVEQIKRCGFNYITLDLQGFRSGNLNEGIK